MYIYEVLDLVKDALAPTTINKQWVVDHKEIINVQNVSKLVKCIL